VIALIDYRAGNLTSVRKALAAVGADVLIPARPAQLRDAGGVIVPGVGHFGSTRTLDDAWVGAIRERLDDGAPLLGICLGMQWLYESSDEAPELRGLGVFRGRCERLGGAADPALKVPHVGWNSLSLRRGGWIVDGVADGDQVYFTHSYAGPAIGEPVAITEHGQPFAAIVERGNVAGVQFHPEKSGDVGLRVLANFVRRCG
jgi:imidazole glycerol-phosphate synthase subunit HisH